MTKTTCLAIAIILASFGIHAQNPFLIHCLDEDSPLLNKVGANVTLCDLDDEDDTWPSCVLSQADRDEDKKLTNLLEVLKRMEVEKNKFEEGSKGLNMSQFEHQLPNLENIKKLMKEMKEQIEKLGVSRLNQKVRVCSKKTNEFFGIKNENLFRIGTMIGILLLVAIAAWATFRLHKIASYKVGFVSTFNGFIGTFFQVLFEDSKSIACGVKNPKLR